MSPKDPAPPIRLRSRMRLNILWLSEEPREQLRVSCRTVHMCEPNRLLLPVQMAGGMCAVMGPSAQRGFELKMSHLVVLCRLRWPSSQLRSLDLRCTWRTQSSRRGSRVAARQQKITRELREALGTASSRAATRSRSFHAAALGLPSCFSKTLYRGEGAKGKMWHRVEAPVGDQRSAAHLPVRSPRPTLPDLPLIQILLEQASGSECGKQQ